MATAFRVPDSAVATRPTPRAAVAESARTRAADSGSRGWRFVLVAGGLLALVVAFLPSASGARWLPVVAGVCAVVAVVEGSLVQLRRDGLRGGLAREPLVLIGLGLCLTVAAEALRSADLSSPTYADGVALSAYPFLIAGMVRLTRSRLKEGAVDTLLIAAIAPAAVFAFAWLPLVDAIAHWTDHGSEQSWRVPILLGVDALAVAVIARLAVMFRGRPIAYQFLLGAAACMLGAHVSRAVSEITEVVPAPLGSQTLLVASFALFGAAALHPSIRRGRGVRTRVVTVGRLHVALLMVAVVVGPALAVLRYGDRGGWVVVVAGGPALVSLLVVAHLSRMITERQRLEFASNHDALTGLVNRGRFHERLGAALATMGSRNPTLAVMFIDLDRFKNVNDTHGHDVGDEMLRAVAGRLRDCVREDDLVARLSGDEFAVLLTRDASEEAVSEVSRRLLGGFADPFRVADRSLSTTLSIGTAFAPEHGDDAETLLRNADSAMYVAKASGRNNAQAYRDGMQTRAHQRLVVEARLREAIDNHELALHYQPKLAAATGAVVGVEALVRWDHPSHGLIPPGAFMHAAEESGLIAPLGTWVLDTACRQAEDWRRSGYGDLSVSVNLSARQFELQDVPTMVSGALADSGLPPRLLELELTESLRLDDDRYISGALHALEELGVRCSIDDFGTGYSNISYLHAYPIDTVKLDRSFVQTVTGPGADSPLVRGVIALAHSLGMRVVAEGVETEDQLAFLQAHSCDEWQGFLFSPGLPATEMTGLLRQGAEAGMDLWPLAAAVPSVEGWDEKHLREVLWRELGISGLRGRDEDNDEDNRHRGVVLAGASGVMALPVFLGLGSAGALPPALQGRLDQTLSAVGAVAPHDPSLRVGGGDDNLATGAPGRPSDRPADRSGRGSGPATPDVGLGLSDPRGQAGTSGAASGRDGGTRADVDAPTADRAPRTAAPSGPTGAQVDSLGSGDGTSNMTGNGNANPAGTGNANPAGNGNAGNGNAGNGNGHRTTDPGNGNGNGNGGTDPGAGCEGPWQRQRHGAAARVAAPRARARASPRPTRAPEGPRTRATGTAPGSRPTRGTATGTGVPDRSTGRQGSRASHRPGRKRRGAQVRSAR